jgi:hypothetical protein
MIEQGYLALCLRLQNVHEMRVRHWMDRIVLERRVFEPLAVDIMHAVDRQPSVLGKAKHHERELFSQRIQHRIEFGTDVAAKDRTGFLKKALAARRA